LVSTRIEFPVSGDRTATQGMGGRGTSKFRPERALRAFGWNASVHAFARPSTRFPKVQRNRHIRASLDGARLAGRALLSCGFFAPERGSRSAPRLGPPLGACPPRRCPTKAWRKGGRGSARVTVNWSFAPSSSISVCRSAAELRLNRPGPTAGAIHVASPKQAGGSPSAWICGKVKKSRSLR